jgi:preprotein translocase subunit SecG
MTAVLLVIHVLVAAGLVATILMQRSEGGALGIGGGGPGGAMSGRAAGDILSRSTMILGAVFMGNSILLAIIANVSSENQSVIERVGGEDAGGSGLPFSFDDVPSDDGDAPAVDATEEPAPSEDEPPADSEPEIPGR